MTQSNGSTALVNSRLRGPFACRPGGWRVLVALGARRRVLVLGFGRIVVSEIEAPNMFVNVV
jgi:hypothetical protein